MLSDTGGSATPAYPAPEIRTKLEKVIDLEGGRHSWLPERVEDLMKLGTEFHGYKDIEARTGVTVYFATPHHSWERGTNENTNGLIRQYLPKRKSMRHITQRHCDWIAEQLNNRPRKRHGYLTPAELYEKT